MSGLPAPDDQDLRPKERAFVAEYLTDFSATGALIRLGWNPQTANAHAHTFLRKPRVRAAIEMGIRRIEAHSVISAARVLEEVFRIATVDPRKAMRPNGTIKELQDLDEDTARAVASIKITSKPGLRGRGTVVTQELKFWDKGRATETLLKAIGKLTEGTQVTNNTVINAGPGALDEARMLELEVKLRETLGLPPREPAQEAEKPVEVPNPLPEPAEAEEDAIAAAHAALLDCLDDPAFQ